MSSISIKLISTLALSMYFFITASGCAKSAAFRLEQPFAPPSQRVLHLDADATYLSESDGRRTIVAEFPLPGSFAGPRAFVLFIEAPRDDAALQIGTGASATRGFLIQEIGALAGKSALQSGTFTCRPVFLSENTHDVAIDAVCVDGTRIQGTLTTKLSAARIQQFRTQFAGDIAALDAPPTEIRTDSAESEAVIETQQRAAATNPPSE
ncbi:MAG: hypothetical protein AB7N71_00855 [Phycisphaerae bacterium]